MIFQIVSIFNNGMFSISNIDIIIEIIIALFYYKLDSSFALDQKVIFHFAHMLCSGLGVFVCGFFSLLFSFFFISCFVHLLQSHIRWQIGSFIIVWLMCFSTKPSFRHGLQFKLNNFRLHRNMCELLCTGISINWLERLKHTNKNKNKNK